MNAIFYFISLAGWEILSTIEVIVFWGILLIGCANILVLILTE
jgi:hypothetical protein